MILHNVLCTRLLLRLRGAYETLTDVTVHSSIHIMRFGTEDESHVFYHHRDATNNHNSFPLLPWKPKDISTSYFCSTETSTTPSTSTQVQSQSQQQPDTVLNPNTDPVVIPPVQRHAHTIHPEELAV